MRDLIHDLLGIDIHVTTKEDLNKEMEDEALSAICFTPEPKEVRQNLIKIFLELHFLSESIWVIDNFIAY